MIDSYNAPNRRLVIPFQKLWDDETGALKPLQVAGMEYVIEQMRRVLPRLEPDANRAEDYQGRIELVETLIENTLRAIWAAKTCLANPEQAPPGMTPADLERYLWVQRELLPRLLEYEHLVWLAYKATRQKQWWQQ
jgi:hypothetical protein